MSTALLALFLSASPARAGVSEARDNMETLVRSFVARQSPDGDWRLKNKKTGKIRKVRLSRFDPDTVRAVGEDLYAGIVEFKDGKGATVYAEFTADFAKSWEVKSVKILNTAEAESRPTSKPKPKHAGPAGQLPDVTLATLDGGSSNVSDCEAKKCVTVYVAPWCPHCRNVTADVVAMRSYLKPLGVDVHIIVGMDEPAAIEEYARSFGPQTMLDPDKAAEPPGGVPNFDISDDSGGVLRRQAGAREGIGGEALAKSLGLP